MVLSYLAFPRGSCATYRFGCIRWRRALFARRFPNRFLLWTLGSVPDLDLEQRRLQPAATNLLRTGAGRHGKPGLVARWTTDRVRYALSRESQHDHGDRFRRRRTQTANRART